MPTYRFQNCVYTWCVSHLAGGEQEREDWDVMLTAPFPNEVVKPTPAQVEAEGEDFMALLGQVNAMKGGDDAPTG